MNRTLFFLIFVVLSAVVTARSAHKPHLKLRDLVTIDPKVNKRSFHSLGCLGEYELSGFTRLERLCEDCYNLYRDSNVRYMCRANCFTSDTFHKCTVALMVDYEDEKIEELINRMYGRE